MRRDGSIVVQSRLRFTQSRAKLAAARADIEEIAHFAHGDADRRSDRRRIVRRIDRVGIESERIDCTQAFARRRFLLGKQRR